MKVTSNLRQGRKSRKKKHFSKRTGRKCRLAETHIEQNNDLTPIMREIS